MRQFILMIASATAMIAGLSAAGVALSQDSQDIGGLAPPTLSESVPRAVVRFAPDRFDDLLWENDRVAHRIYGPALQVREPPSGSGVDAWSKRVRYPFMDRQLRFSSYHVDRGEGLDGYDVGRSRGVGGLGVWFDNKLWTSRNFNAYEILETGGQTARFRADYRPWPVDVVRRVWESRTFTLPMGTNFTRMVSTIRSDSPEPLIVAIGIGKRRTAAGVGVIARDQASGRMTFWEPTDPVNGTMGLAVMVDPAMIAGFIDDADNYLVLLRVTPGQPFVYYAGSAWDRGLDFHTREAWDAYVAAQRPDFDPGRQGI